MNSRSVFLIRMPVKVKNQQVVLSAHDHLIFHFPELFKCDNNVLDM
jgi:hypothetical protein